MTTERRKEIEKYIMQKLEEIRFDCEDIFDDTDTIHLTISEGSTYLFALDKECENHVLRNRWTYNV